MISLRILLILVILFICVYEKTKAQNDGTPPMCYTCRNEKSNFNCNKQAERCPTGMNACETSITIAGSGHLGRIRKGCTRTCNSRRRHRNCRPPGCVYCCDTDLCNAGLSRPELRSARSRNNRNNRNTNRNTNNDDTSNTDNVNTNDNSANDGGNTDIDDNNNRVDNQVGLPTSNGVSNRAGANNINVQNDNSFAFTVISENVTQTSDETLLLNVTSVVQNSGGVINEAMRNTELFVDKAGTGGGNTNIRKSTDDSNRNQPSNTGSNQRKQNNNQELTRNSSPRHGIALSASEQEELSEIDIRNENPRLHPSLDATTVPTSSRKLKALFTIVATDVIQDDVHTAVKVNQVLVNMGDIIKNEIETTEFAITNTGIYVFHVTSVASGSGLLATPLVLLKNEKIVLKTGRAHGHFISAFPIGVGHVTLLLEARDTIRLMTAPRGATANPGLSFSAPSDVTFSGYMIS